MGTFTIDLISGKAFLFDKDFSSTGGTSPTGGTGTYPEVNTYSELPTPSSYNGKTYLVRTSTGDFVLNRKEAGLYISNGLTWRRLGDIPSFFLSDNHQIIDSTDNTKGFEFETSGLTTNIFRRIKIQDNDGTIAYLTDLDSKVDINVFNDYTGTTAPLTYLSIDNFNNYSGITETRLVGIENDILFLSGATDNKLSIDDFNIYSGITNTRITKLEEKQTTPLQLKSISGGSNINTITPTIINWDIEEYSGTSINFSGGSRINILDDSDYEISYSVNYENQDNNRKNIGSVIRKNNTNDITPLTTSSYVRNVGNGVGNVSISDYMVNLSSGDYIELLVFRTGNSGTALTIPNANWFKIIKK